MKGASCVALFLSHKNCRRFVCVPQRKKNSLGNPNWRSPEHSFGNKSVSQWAFSYLSTMIRRVLFCDKNGPHSLGTELRFHYSICVKSSGESSSDFRVLSCRRFSSLEGTKIRITLALIRKWVYAKISHAAAISRPSRSRTMLNGVVIVNSDNKGLQLLPLRICSRYWEQLCANELFLFQPIKRKFYKTSFNTSSSALRRHTFVCSIKKSW